MTNVENLTNNTFKTLSFLYDLRDKENEVRVTQNEVSTSLCLSRATINKIFGILKNENYIEQDKIFASKYCLTERAISVIQNYRNAN